MHAAVQRFGLFLVTQEEEEIAEERFRFLHGGRQHQQRPVEPPRRQEDRVGLGAPLEAGDALLAAPFLAQQSGDLVVE